MLIFILTRRNAMKTKEIIFIGSIGFIATLCLGGRGQLDTKFVQPKNRPLMGKRIGIADPAQAYSDYIKHEDDMLNTSSTDALISKWESVDEKLCISILEILDQRGKEGDEQAQRFISTISETDPSTFSEGQKYAFDFYFSHRLNKE